MNATSPRSSAETLSDDVDVPAEAAEAGDKPLLDFDDVLPHIGEFGFYQKCLFLMMIPFAWFVAFVYFSQIFITLVPEGHWCHIPELQDLNPDERLALGVPKTAELGYARCLQYDVNFTELVRQGVRQADPSWPTVACRHGWEFNRTEVPYESIAAELEWVCDNAALPNVAQSVFFGGAIVGGLLFGWVADRWGRVPALVGSNMVGLAAGIATAWAGSFWVFALCRFFVGFAFDNCFTMMYILVLEYVGPKWRTFVANMSIAIFFTMAASLLPWLAYWLADWRLLCIATSAPLLLAALTPWLVPESARWLVSQGRVEEALVIMKRLEKSNGTAVPAGVYQQFEDSCIKLKKQEDADKTYSVVDLFRSPRLRNTTLLLIVIWMIVSLVFDGHVRNVGQLGLDVFVTFTVASATELPADSFLTVVLDRWGRRWLACGSMVVSGLFSLGAVAAPPGVVSASLAIMGRFSVNISYNIGLQYAAELLPTVVRAQGVALIHIMGYVASILAPFVVYLSVVHPALPLLILGSMGVVGGVLALFLPETLDQDLPQTLADGEQFGRDQRFFEFPCCGTRPMETPKPALYRATSHRASLRASTRGEALRSSMIHRGSISSRRSAGKRSSDDSSHAGAAGAVV
ncbi:organic cation transporter protein [Thrips palmi]|uniref:Organic cation transporter protein n=1 Tax=Thrips palmi TaxID=161013 RepID=A0A6P8Z545_THRPL|nr:organic cation transporter protein [Thrips palmi]